MKKIVLSEIIRTVLVLVVFCNLSIIALSQENAISTDERRKAEKAWEALIKTKGGREKLHSVRNMLTEFNGFAQLNVFPNRVWEFAGPFFGGVSASIYDGTKSTEIYANETGVTSTRSIDLSDWLVIDRVQFLLETKWDKPELLRVTQIKKDKKVFDVIQAVVGKLRMDFVYEPEEMLVLEVNFYDKNNVLWKKYEFSDYTEINGIKMPQTFGNKQSYRNLEKLKYAYTKIKFSFNVEYDPQLFERPLKATTPDAWKPKQ